MSNYHPRAPADVHSIAVGMLPRLRGRVLDAAAGDGNVSRLMTEMGFRVISADLHFDRPHELAAPVEVDFNRPLPFDDCEFDGVVTIETIEHLENPWLFMRELARTIRVGGFVIVTTPNVQNVQSRLRMVFKGDLEWFRPRHLQPLGHITPIFDFLLDEMARRVGFKKDALQFSQGRIPKTSKRISINSGLFGECRITRFIKQ